MGISYVFVFPVQSSAVIFLTDGCLVSLSYRTGIRTRVRVCVTRSGVMADLDVTASGDDDDD